MKEREKERESKEEREREICNCAICNECRSNENYLSIFYHHQSVGIIHLFFEHNL